MSTTERALIKRGFASALAKRLASAGHSVAKLTTLDDDKLAELGISSEQRKALRKGRPPIPDAVADGLLYRSKHTCCVCRDSSRGVVIHHMRPWAASRSHDEANLVVLCPVCHDLAHTKKELTHELTPRRLRHHKCEWEREVKQQSTTNLFAGKPWDILEPIWDMFNRQRILDVACTLGVDISQSAGYAALSSGNHTYAKRRFRWEDRLRIGGESEYTFFDETLQAIFHASEWLDLRRLWTRTQVRTLARPGSLFALTAHYRFRPKTTTDRGPGQMRFGYYQARKIRVEFTFDAWECTSNSAYSHNLVNGWTCTLLGLVRSVEETQGVVLISATCLALGTGFTEYRGAKPRIAYEREVAEEFDL